MQTVQLTLQIEEINTVLEALGQLPYIRVYRLIGTIQQQAQEQLQQDPGSAATSAQIRAAITGDVR